MTFTVFEVVLYYGSMFLLMCVMFPLGKRIGKQIGFKQGTAEAEAIAARTDRNLAAAKRDLELAQKTREAAIDMAVAEKRRQLQAEAERRIQAGINEWISDVQNRINTLENYQFRREITPAERILVYHRQDERETTPAEFGQLYGQMLADGYYPVIRITPTHDPDGRYRVEITAHVLDDADADGSEPREVCLRYMLRSRANVGRVLEHLFPYHERSRRGRQDGPPPAIVVANENRRSVDLG